MSNLLTKEQISSWECAILTPIYYEVLSEVQRLRKSCNGAFPAAEPVFDRIEDMCKGVISTPMRDGKLHWDGVPVGASVWITAKRGPMAGGHVLITKRGDGLAAVAGEYRKRSKTKVPAAMQKPFDPEKQQEKPGPKKEEPAAEADKKARTKERSKEIAARRHLAMRMDTVKVSKKAEEFEKEKQRIIKEEAPQVQAAKELATEARKAAKEAEVKLAEAVGVDRSSYTKAEKAAIGQAVRDHYQDQGLPESEADRVAKFAERLLNSKDSRHRKQKMIERAQAIERKYAERKVKGARISFASDDLETVNDEGKHTPALPTGEFASGRTLPESDQPLTEQEYEPQTPDQRVYTLPELPEDTSNLSDPALESMLVSHFDRQEAFGQEGEDIPKDHVSRDEEGVKIVTGGNGSTAEVVKAAVENEDAANAIKELFDEHKRKHAEATEIRRSLRSNKLKAKKFSSSATLDDMKLHIKEGLSDAELERIADEYVDRVMQGNSAASFYEAVTPHWNDAVGNTLSQHTTDGASTALTALMPTGATGARYEAGKLVEHFGPEAAARILAFDLKMRMSQDEYTKFMHEVRDKNAAQLEKTEQEALSVHTNLMKEEGVIKKDIESGRLGEDSGTFYQAENLERQRRNLGVALGSMAASAAFYDALQKASKSNDASISIILGHSDVALQHKLAALKLKEGPSLGVRHDPSKGWIIDTNARHLNQSRFISKTKQEAQRNDEWEAVKNDTSSTEGYTSDGLRTHFPEDVDVLRAAGLPADLAGKPITLRQEQRNDLEWYKRSGGGVISRTTGAGKTLTALGAHGHEIANNPDYKGLIVVPRKAVEQWKSQADAFTDMDVRIVPPDAPYDVRRQIYQDVKPGEVLVVAHDHAGSQKDSLDIYEAGFDGATIDEPQELTTKGKGRLGAGARRIMKIPFDKRLALTATPAKKNAVGSFDLVRWTNPNNSLGYRTRFDRAYGGFGEGTNAQDAATVDALWGELAPYVSGGKISKLPFEINTETRNVSRTPQQLDRAKELEAGVAQRIQDEMDSVPAEKRVGPWRKRSKERVMRQVYKDHADNLHGGDAATNAKVQSFVEKMGSIGEGKKHVIFVDSQKQKRAIKEALKNMGYTNYNMRDITASQKSGRVEKSKREWTSDKENKIPFIFVDPKSSAGHNLQAGEVMHIMGLPETGADLRQLMGRIARTDDSDQRKQINFVTYSHEDSPFELQRKNELGTQLKVLRATAPAVMSGGY